MYNPETFIFKLNRCNRHLVDVFTDEKKTVKTKTPNGTTAFDEITKLITI